MKQAEEGDQPEAEIECSLDAMYDGSDKSIDVTLTASEELGAGTNLALYYKNPSVTNWTAYSITGDPYVNMTKNEDGSATYNYTITGLNLTGSSVVDLRVDAVQGGETLATATLEDVSIG